MKYLLTVFMLITFLDRNYAQQTLSSNNNVIQIIFWNVENLFDTEDDSLKQDEEFLPYGIRGWNRERYQKKLFNTYKLIVAAGQWKLPEVIALAEVENKKVLLDLLANTPLHRAGYQIIHKESEDSRGIDLAILYRADRIQIIDTSFIQLTFPDDADRKSRDIIYLKSKQKDSEPFHLFVNHWPSRYGGGKGFEKRRIYAATVIKENVDSILNMHPDASIIVTGDFNDTPNDYSLQLMAGSDSTLINISDLGFYGTHKHQGLWNHFDQVWISHSLWQGKTFYVKNQKAEVFHPDWLLENDKTFGGVKPNRTYEGYRYHGGFSDHLPVFLELHVKPATLAEKVK